MADIVGVHGVGWHESSRTEMIDLWCSHIARGLRDIRSPRHLDFTFEATFYGTHYNVPQASKGSASDRELTKGFETDLLLEVAGPLMAEGSFDRKAYLPRVIQWALRQLESTDYFAAAGHYALIKFVKQVGRYFADLDLRAAVQQEFLTAVGTGARVVIAHSLGSIIAYEVLRDQPNVQVDTLITIGSPLGLRVIRERLGVAANQKGDRPGGLQRWLNIAAKEDAVAVIKQLTDHYNLVEDCLVRNSRVKAHLAVRYLSSVPTSEAISIALR